MTIFSYTGRTLLLSNIISITYEIVSGTLKIKFRLYLYYIELLLLLFMTVTVLLVQNE